MEPPGPQLEVPEWAAVCPAGPKAAQGEGWTELGTGTRDWGPGSEPKKVSLEGSEVRKYVSIKAEMCSQLPFKIQTFQSKINCVSINFSSTFQPTNITQYGVTFGPIV